MRTLILCFTVAFSWLWATQSSIARNLDQKTNRDLIPFDLQVAKLSPGYRGNDPNAFFKVFAAKGEPSKRFSEISRYQKLTQLKKGEFETTEEFETRKRNSSLHPIDQKKLYAFEVPDVYAEYDADKQTIRVKTNTEIKDALDDHSQRVIQLSYLHRDKSKYSASNSYGAVRTVSKLEAETVYIAVPKDSRFIELFANNKAFNYSFYKNYALDLELPANANEGKRFKANDISLLVIGKVADNRMLNAAFDFKEPTIDLPYDHIILGWAIPFNIDAVFVYLKKTGEIVKRIDLVDPQQKND